MDHDDLVPAKQQAIEIGGDLSQLSIGELQERIGALKAEIARVEADIKAKSSSRQAAESVFKI
ncbi:MAG TPA: DUF1192 domain-containing protein [Hyphomicrobiales bacterium]|nr:DUF1192 domain-containing protein [Rhodobiaceae bacterium]HXK53312.1 DUF1192 domain-containing protein [Hyphomicrobiales bacterium]